MSLPSENPILESSLTRLKYLFTSINSLFQSQRRAWTESAKESCNSALIALFDSSMKDNARLLNMTQYLLGKLIDLAEIKTKQMELKVQAAGREWLADKEDYMKDSRFALGRLLRRESEKRVKADWEFGLNMVPELQARLDVMRETLKTLDVSRPIEELTPLLTSFTQAAMESNDRMWAFGTKLLENFMVIDESLADATLAVTRSRYPEADKLAKERYGGN
jgi:hypothetical protein